MHTVPGTVQFIFGTQNTNFSSFNFSPVCSCLMNVQEGSVLPSYIYIEGVHTFIQENIMCMMCNEEEGPTLVFSFSIFKFQASVKTKKDSSHCS